MDSQRVGFFVVIVILSISVLGCSTSTYMSNRPYVLEACPWAGAADPQTAALAALVQALHDNRWSIVQGDAAHGYVRARACRHTYCIAVDSFVDAGGTIELFVAPGQDISRNGSQLLEGWMHKLGRRYERYRCDPPPNALALIEKLYLPSGSAPVKPLAAGN